MSVFIVLLGPPGAGKGTQSQRLAGNLGLPHVSTGEIFRQHISEETPIGLKVKCLLEQGHLAPDELACEVVMERLAQPDCAQGCVLDGFPRSVNQAAALDRMLAASSRSLTMAILIDVTDDEIVDRLALRRSCPLCGRIYNLRYDPPQNDGVCDNAQCEGQPLLQREDDTETVIRERLRVYHRNDEPIIQYYAQRGKLRAVEANGLSSEGVFEKIESLLNTTDPAYAQ